MQSANLTRARLTAELEKLEARRLVLHAEIAALLPKSRQLTKLQPKKKSNKRKTSKSIRKTG